MRILFATLLLIGCGTQEKETQQAPAPEQAASEAPAQPEETPELVRLDVESVWVAYDSEFWVYATPTVTASKPAILLNYKVGVAMSPADTPPEDCENGVYSGVSDYADSRIQIKGVEPGEYLLTACVIDLENGKSVAALSKEVSFVK